MQPKTWDDLTRELDAWAEANRVATLWWRDDDAVAPTPALMRMLDLTDRHGLELGLAAIPADAQESLAGALADRPYVAVLQHGYRHRNHAPRGEPAIECGGPRPTADVIAELTSGRRRMETLFAERFAPILAAPWNRIAPPVLARLAAAGFLGASAMGPRGEMPVADGLVVVNAHLDFLNWKERRFAGLSKALSGLIGELTARRTGSTDPDEPLGLLTHHLDHDEAAWEFLEGLLAFIDTHPAARWVGARDIFGLQPAVSPAAAEAGA